MQISKAFPRYFPAASFRLQLFSAFLFSDVSFQYVRVSKHDCQHRAAAGHWRIRERSLRAHHHSSLR